MAKETKIMAVLLVLALVAPAFADQIVAWGRNDTGQCDVPAGDDFVTISAESGHSLAIKSDGSLVAWGSNAGGQCNVPTGSDFVVVSGGWSYSFALKSDGSIIAWGSNSFVQQDDVPEGNDFVDISGGLYYSAALKSDGAIVGWGENYFGQCDVPAGNDFVTISAGGIHGLALKSDGSLATWGDNRYGQRHNVPETNDFVAISGGWYHSLALKSDGSVVAWGMNNHAQCNVPADNDFIAIGAGRYHSLGLKSDGSLIAWGLNADGQCNVPAGTNFSAISAGRYQNLAIISEPSTLVVIEIIGPEDVRKNYHAQYKAVAHYDDGTKRNATRSATWWLEPNTIASIDANGLLQTGDIPVSEDITIFASYTEGGITSQIEKTVLISVPQILHVPTDYQTIQEAIDVARYNDTVVIADGIYTGQGNRNIDFRGKAITVRSENGPKNCVIDCQNSTRGFYFHNGENINSLVAGFRIINGYGVSGGGIYCSNSSPTISNCAISNNMAGEGGGGGIRCRYDSSPIISNCTITGNLAGAGGGIYCSGGSPIITNCTVSGNSAYIGGGMLYRANSPTITNCTITGNSAAMDGGGIGCYYNSDLIITNCILWDNTATRGKEILILYIEVYGRAYPSIITINYSDVEGGFSEAYVESGCTLNWGRGNIDVDPCFVDPGYWDANYIWIDGDYHLLRTSPCIDAGDPNFVADPNQTDLDGNPRIRGDAIDMGAYETIIHEARLLVLPRVINRKSSKPRIMAWVRLPQGITRDQIDSDTALILYPAGIKAMRQFIIPNRRRGTVSIFAVFDKAELMDAIPASGRVELQVLGYLSQPGQYFSGCDTIRIIPRLSKPQRQLKQIVLRRQK